ncbi:MAG: potassium channel family protein [Thermodesulfobacteriota bacterium]
MIKDHLYGFIRALHREQVFALILAILLLIFLGGLGFYLAEPGESSPLAFLGRGLWWAMVTVTTVGYGDVVPQTFWGKVVGVGLMVGGVVTISLVTATVASIFIGRKFRQERGLEAIKSTNHLLVLGWHYDGVALLDHLIHRLPVTMAVVLVNQLPPEQLENLKGKFPHYEFAYVWGDFTREDILQKANASRALRAIILGGRREGETGAQADQRTLLTALTLKSLNPKVSILAELHRTENRAYLERAGVDEILIRGQYDSSLMARAVTSPGLFHIFTGLLSGDVQNLWAVEIPPNFQGLPLKEFAAYLKASHQALLIAVYTEGRALALEDLLSGAPSAIDDFIRRKFTETGMTHLFGRAKVEFQVNPPDDLVLEAHQYAVVIASERPVL